MAILNIGKRTHDLLMSIIVTAAIILLGGWVLACDGEIDRARVVHKWSYLLIVLILSVSSVFIICWFNNINQRIYEVMRKKAARQSARAEVAAKAVEEMDRRIIKAEIDNLHLLYKNIDVVCSRYYVCYSSRDVARRKMAEAFEKELGELVNRSKEGNIVTILGEKPGHHVAMLDQQDFFLSEAERQLLCYMLMGLSADTSGYILNLAPDVIYSRKWRLKQKIKRSKYADKESLLRYL